MKLFTIIFIILTIILSTTACRTSPKADNTSSERSETSVNSVISVISEESSVTQSSSSKPVSSVPSSSAVTSLTSSSQATVSSKPEEVEEKKEPYEALVCRDVTSISWQRTKFTDSINTNSFTIELPSDWNLVKSGSDEYSVLRNGKEIGKLYLSEPEKADELFEQYSGFSFYSFSVERAIARYGKDDYYRILNITDNINSSLNVYFKIKYTELDDMAFSGMSLSLGADPSDRAFKKLSETNNSNKILILGNSFVGSSRIGDFLNNMLEQSGHNYTVQAISRGYAEVYTYSNDYALLSEIINGEYCYVFQCGFYSTVSVEPMITIYNACEQSNTGVAMFPAHNESDAVIQAVGESLYKLPCLNWKDEINTLINSGVNYYDLCINDSHKHSSPLAGYVGAHMIYRTLFNEMPPSLNYNAPLAMSYINLKLGSYIEEGNSYKEVLPEFLIN